MKQASFFETEQPLVVFRYRIDEDCVEVRWPDHGLLACFQDWRVALDMIPFYEASTKVVFSEASVRVRR